MSSEPDIEGDPWLDPDIKRWMTDVLVEMVPKLRESAAVCSIMPMSGKPEGDIKYWVELGATIMMDKPLLVIAVEGDNIPPKLRLIADHIVYTPRGVPLSECEEAAASVADWIRTEAMKA